MPLWHVDNPGDRLSHGMPSRLVKNRISDNVGRVKRFLSVLSRALEEERHFALAEQVPCQPRLAP
jgi:hypothetical protein